VSISTRRISRTGALSTRPPLRSTASRIRRCFAIALFTAIALACARPQLLVFPFGDRASMQRRMTIEPDRGGWWPHYPAFLADVHDATRRGDSIALLVPPQKWDDGYSYAYYRASYFLAGREVLPLIDDLDRHWPQNESRARYLAVWRMPAPPGWRVVMQSHGGALLVR
jgi:hypothetical protein